VGSDTIEGNLSVPDGAEGIVLFAHGAGSSRHSSRNNFVAEELRDGGLATLLIDLLTAEEKDVDRRTRRVRFDIDRLARRVVGTVDWMQKRPETADLSLGIFGSSTGAAGALIAAAERPDVTEAVVSRGGRVDLAQAVLDQVEAATLFIVGGRDVQVLNLNRNALAQLETTRELEVVAGATHLFEEPGALEEVARLAREWFQRYLTA
jgi:dienelactone hydrolase